MSVPSLAEVAARAIEVQKNPAGMFQADLERCRALSEKMRPQNELDEDLWKQLLIAVTDALDLRYKMVSSTAAYPEDADETIGVALGLLIDRQPDTLGAILSIGALKTGPYSQIDLVQRAFADHSGPWLQG